MEITLTQASRTFGPQVVFQGLDFHLAAGQMWAILGGNGSGKSTLLKVLYGALSPSGGNLLYSRENKPLSPQEAARRISFAAPYFELIEELPALEFLHTYQRLRPLTVAPGELLEKAWLAKAARKPIAHFSSGMKQRLRLALALYSEGEVLLLDEPTSNLDQAGVEWFQNRLAEDRRGRSLVIGSNYQPEELILTQNELHLKNYQ